MPLVVEICVEGIASAIAAGEGGADRIELCENLAVGGLTPSIGTMMSASQNVGGTIHVLIRPRGGDFVYSAHELDVIKNDLQRITWEAGGVVLGVLDDHGRIDVGAMRSLIELARPKSVTFHRAFDVVRDPFEALEMLVDLGVDRVLTSGRPGAARDSIDLLARLVERAKDRITILAGGSIRAADLQMLASAGIKEVHIGSASCENGRTAAQRVAQLVACARSLTR